MSFAGKQSEEVEGQRAALAITECIAAWLTEIKDKFKGRFPDDVRAAHRAVHQAAGFSAKATEHSASAAAQGRALDTNPALMIEERRRWHAWFAGDVDGRVAMHIQMWADKYPEEWADFIVEMWLREECTRINCVSSCKLLLVRCLSCTERPLRGQIAIFRSC